MSLLQEKIRELQDVHDNGVKDISNTKYKSYDEIFHSSQDYARVFSDYNQEIVTVILPNSIQYIEVMLACILTGNIFNPIPYFTSDNELERIFNYVDPNLVITDRQLPKKFKQNKLTYNPETIVKDSKNTNFDSEFNSLGSDIAALYYSSGTTGNPKGVLYSHDNIFYLIESINRGFGFTSNTKHFSILPFGHTASINYNIYPCLFSRSSLVVAESFSNIAPNFFKIISEEKINYTQLVPTIVYMLLKINYQIDQLNLNSLMFIGCGSSVLPKETQIQFQEKFDIKIANLYGLSETGPTHIDDPRDKEWAPGTIGLPLDVNTCKISEESEILIKGKNVFVGYYKNQELYNQVVKDDWFFTGDIVSYENGRYIYKDRSKDLIIKGGINIVPAEIEEVLYIHKDVHEAVAIGMSHDVLGEEIIASISLKDDSKDKSDIKAELYTLLSENLSSYKHPIDILFFDSLPKTHSGKLKRREVRRIIQDEHNK